MYVYVQLGAPVQNAIWRKNRGSVKIFTKLHNETIPTPHFTSPNTYLVEMNMTPHFTT